MGLAGVLPFVHARNVTSASRASGRLQIIARILSLTLDHLYHTSSWLYCLKSSHVSMGPCVAYTCSQIAQLLDLERH